VLSGLEIALAAAAMLIGLTGTWSPCGFSMVETIGPTGHTGGRRTVAAASLTFIPGAVAGGILTFGLLALVGGFVHGGRVAYLIAAIAEARGAPIVPQIRRQLPEHWRRVLPMPLAAALYGALLGLGFTTFVLSFGVWALAGISFAVGELEAGVVIGAAFGIGRAIPIAVLAPLADRPAGIRAVELMGERPGLYRGFRVGDGLALVVAAGALVTTGTATAAQSEVQAGADPSAEEGELAFQHPDRSGALRRTQGIAPLPGTDPALGGPFVAVISGEQIHILDRATLDRVGEVGAGQADAVAVSGEWLVYRTSRDGHDSLWARRITNPLDPSDAIGLASVGAPSQLGRPSVNGTQLSYAIAKSRVNRIVLHDLPRGRTRTVLRSKRSSLSNPSIRDRQLLYVEIGHKRQRVRLKTLGKKGRGRKLYSLKRGKGVLWSTSLASDRAYFTVLQGGDERIISVAR
jgi:hypothetical protein